MQKSLEILDKTKLVSVGLTQTDTFMEDSLK
jgi:hypothetical protein